MPDFFYLNSLFTPAICSPLCLPSKCARWPLYTKLKWSETLGKQMYHICMGDLSFLYDKYSNNNCSVEPFTQNPTNESSDVNSGLYGWTENAAWWLANINVKPVFFFDKCIVDLLAPNSTVYLNHMLAFNMFKDNEIELYRYCAHFDTFLFISIGMENHEPKSGTSLAFPASTWRKKRERMLVVFTTAEQNTDWGFISIISCRWALIGENSRASPLETQAKRIA